MSIGIHGPGAGFFVNVQVQRFEVVSFEKTLQIIVFTATPVNNPGKILEVCENLRVAKIYVTGSTDYDVGDYISLHTIHIAAVHE